MDEISVNGYAYPYINQGVLEQTLPYLTFVTVFTYGFTPSGELIVPDDAQITEQSWAGGAAPLMLLSTLTESGTFSNELAHAILNDIASQDILIENILTVLREKPYYGLDIDFEYILPEDREAYVSFVRRAAERLRQEEKPVLVALAPKVSADQPGLLYESHDYRALGEAADWVLLMTYEWGYTQAGAGSRERGYKK